MIQKRYFALYGLFILVIFSMIVVVVVGRRVTTDNRSKASPATVLKLSPEKISPKQGEEFTLTALVETGGNSVTMVLPHLVFDPNKVSFLGFTRTSQFPQLISDVIVKNENIELAVGAKSLADRVTGLSTVGEFTFRVNPIATGPTMISFADSAYAGLVGPGAINTLIGRMPADIDIPRTLPDPPTDPRCMVHVALQ